MMAYGNADLPHLLTYFPVLAPTFMLVFVVLFYFFLLRSFAAIMVVTNKRARDLEKKRKEKKD